MTNSSVFIAKRNTGEPMPIFKKKGVPHLMPGPVGETTIYILAKSFLTFPIRLFRLLVTAISINGLVATGAPFKNVFKGIRQLSVTFDIPVCTFRFGSLSPGEINELKGMGLQQDQTNSLLFVGSPAVHHLARINQMGPVGDRIRPGHINFEAFLAWTYLMKGIQIFTTAWNASHATGYNVGVDKAGATVAGESNYLNAISGGPFNFNNTGKKDIAPSSGEYVVAVDDKSLQEFRGSFHEVSATRTWSKGVFFPFFSGMSTADKETSAKVFNTLFYGLLAEKEELNVSIMTRIRSGVRQLAFSKAGMVLAHIYKVFELVQDLKDSKVTIVHKGSVYVGVAVEGDIRLSMYGVEYESGDLASEIGKINLLDTQADKVCELLNSVEDANNHRVYNFIRSDFLKSRIALHSFLSVDQSLFHSSDTITKVRDILEAMEFNDVFPVPTHAMIMDAVSFMLTGTYDRISKYPAFLGGGVLHSTSRTYEAFSMFGPRIPSCNTGGSKDTMIMFPSVGKEDTNLTRVNGIRPLHYFPFWSVPISEGCTQWDRLVSSGTLHLPKGRKNKKEFVNLSKVFSKIDTDPNFTTLYENIKTMVNDSRSAGKAGLKRKRDGEDDQAARKRKRNVEEDNEF